MVISFVTPSNWAQSTVADSRPLGGPPGSSSSSDGSKGGAQTRNAGATGKHVGPCIIDVQVDGIASRAFAHFATGKIRLMHCPFDLVIMAMRETQATVQTVTRGRPLRSFAVARGVLRADGIWGRVAPVAASFPV